MAYGMFGPDTADIQATLDAENWQKRYKGDSLEDSVGNLFQSGFGLAAKAMGAEDPRMSRAKKMEEVKKYAQENAKGNDTLSYYKSLSEAFKKFGMIEEAMNIEKVIAQLEDKDLDRQVKVDQIAATKEARLAAAAAKKKETTPMGQLQSLLKDVYKDASVESKNKAISLINAGFSIEEATSVLTDKEGKQMKVTLGVPNKPELVQDAIIVAGKPVFTGEPYKKAPGVSVDMRGQTIDQDILGADAKESRKTHNVQYKAAQDMRPVVNRYKMLLDKGLITGTASELRTALQRAWVTSGAGSEEDAKKLSDSDLFDSTVMELVLPKMAQLGGSDSNEELAQIRKMTGDRKMQPATLRRIIEIIDGRISEVDRKETAYDAYIGNGGSPSKWNWNTGAPFGTPVKKETKKDTPAPTQITSEKIAKYKAYVKQVTGKDITDAQAEQALKHYQPK